ncbi:hypothetical protein [Caldicellulosiruptor changbaiensis]|uniref:hypothetical protein n=1 Tax=Caldicellulosiruptor changbaiensis TaxID=1222016 RepID=UPI0019D08B20|nr:hypothetical protein [Caldicellulosiruptor changbaiensis]
MVHFVFGGIFKEGIRVKFNQKAGEYNPDELTSNKERHVAFKMRSVEKLVT